MKKFIISNGFLYTVGLVFVLLAWLLISLSLGQGNLIFPTPFDVFAKTGELLTQPRTYVSLGNSLLRTVIGFSVSFLLALFFGSLAGQVKPLQRFFRPMILILKSAPTAAFVFLFLVLSGSRNAPIWIVSLLAFPILYDAVVGGINAVPEILTWASRVDQASPVRTLVSVKIPLAAPYVILGVLNSLALSFKTEIMAEIITGDTSAGLGGMIRYFRNDDPADLTPVFAVTLLAIAVVLLFDLAAYIGKKALKKA